MGLFIDESFLPAKLTAPPMNEEQFATFGSEHSDLRFEINGERDLIVMAPASFKTGARNFWINVQFGLWAEQDGRGRGFDASAGFVLPSSAILSPDVAWKSPSDRLPVLREKMNPWIASGAQLGWLIDSDTRSVEVYRPGAAPEVFVDPQWFAGEGPVAGFVLTLGRRIWEPLDR